MSRYAVGEPAWSGTFKDGYIEWLRAEAAAMISRADALALTLEPRQPTCPVVAVADYGLQEPWDYLRDPVDLQIPFMELARILYPLTDEQRRNLEAGVYFPSWGK